MFYKNWPYWLKWGIFFVIIYLFLIARALIYAHTCREFLCELSASYTLVGFAWPILGIFYKLDMINSVNFSLVVILNLILVFAIGALFSWIYKKIKGKNLIAKRWFYWLIVISIAATAAFLLFKPI